jgi:hypothetical protein
MGIMTAITTTTIVISMKSQSEGNNYRSARPRRSKCIFKQMPVGELAAMVQGRRQLQSAGRA